MLGGPSVKQSIRGIDCSDGRHRQCVWLVPLQPLTRFDPQVQLQRAVNPLDPLVVPGMAFDVAQVQKASPKPPGLPGVGQSDQPIGDLRVLVAQLRAVAIAGLADPERPAGQSNADPNYCHRVTANDGAIGDQHLRDFQDNDKTVPTILTTSQKLSTGVDARNVRHIVLMRPVRSMIEFKQIIGRGTRTYDGKDFFTIWDFVKAHENFNDPEWNGPPQQVIPPKRARPGTDVPKPGAGGEPPMPGGEGGDGGEGGECRMGGDGGNTDDPKPKIMVTLADGKARSTQYIATTTYWGPDGKPISATEFLQRLFGDLSGMVANEDQLRAIWSNPDNREQFLTQLDDHGYHPDRLDDIRKLVDAAKSDLYDVLSTSSLPTRPRPATTERTPSGRMAWAPSPAK